MKLTSKIMWAAMLTLGLALLPQTAAAQSGTGRFISLPDGGRAIVHQLSFLSQAQKSTVDTLASAVNAYDTTSTAPIDVRGIERATLFVRNNWNSADVFDTLELPDTLFAFIQLSLDGTNYTAPIPMDTIYVAINPGTINGPEVGMMVGTKAPTATDTTSYRPLQLWPPMMRGGTIDSLSAPAAIAGAASGVALVPQRDIPANRLAFRGINLPSYRNAKFYFRINNAAADTTALQVQAYLEWPGR